MQCRQTVWRKTCRHDNAYHAASALRATFCTTTNQRGATSEPLISLWELDRAGPHSSGKETRVGLTQKSKAEGSNVASKHKRPEDQHQPSSTDEHALRIHKAIVHQLAGSKKQQKSWKLQLREISDKAAEYYASVRQKQDSKDHVQDIELSLDYEGLVIPPAKSAHPEPLPFPWALAQGDRSSEGGVDPVKDLLSSEIERFAAYMKPTPGERAARDHVINDLKLRVGENTARSGKLRANGELFGSETTGLAFATSDIDIRVYDKAFEQQRRRQQLKRQQPPTPDAVAPTMRKIAHDLRRPDSPYICVHYRPGLFPIISAIHEPSGLDIHIVGTSPKHAQQDSTRTFVKAHPNLLPLYALLHAALSTRGMLDTFSGGFGSYGTMVLVLFAIARHPSSSSHPPSASSEETITPSPPSTTSSPPPPPSSSPPISLGQHLLSLLSLYSSLDPSRHGLTLRPRARLFLRHLTDLTRSRATKYSLAARRRGDPVRAEQWRPRFAGARVARAVQPYLLAIQDPADCGNDLGLKATGVRHFVETMKGLERDMRDLLGGIEGRGEGGGRDTDGGKRSLLEPLLGRYHEVNAARREKLEGFGRGVSKKREEKSRDGTLRLRGTAMGLEQVRRYENEGNEVGIRRWRRLGKMDDQLEGRASDGDEKERPSEMKV